MTTPYLLLQTPHVVTEFVEYPFVRDVRLGEAIPLGQLYDMCTTCNETLAQRHSGDAMGLLRAKGDLATKAGFLVSMVAPNDPDEPDSIDRLRQAAAELDITF